MTTPFWPRPDTSHPVAFPADSHFDAVVVGAGFTGLTTARLLAEAGRRVAVLEARTVGAGASGSTTAKTTLLQGVRLSTLARTHSIDVAGDYLAAHRFGQDWLRKFCEDNAVDVDVASAFTYAPTEDSAADVRREYETARQLGLPVVLHDNLLTPFPVHTAVELPEQFQLNPADLLAALARRVTDAGGVVVEGARVTDLTADDEAGRVTVTTTAGDMTAGQVVLATATPILDTGTTTMSLVPERSYLCAYEPAPGSVLPDGMFCPPAPPASPCALTWAERRPACWSAAPGTGRASPATPTNRSRTSTPGPRSTSPVRGAPTAGPRRTTTPSAWFRWPRRCPGAAAASTSRAPTANGA